MTQIFNEFENKIREAILSHESFNEEWDIEVHENGGVITLTGSVPSKEDVKLIESIVVEQDGVITVLNEIRVDDDNDSSIDNLWIFPPGE